MAGLSVFSPSRVAFLWWGKDSSRLDSFKETLMKILRVMIRIPMIALSAAATFKLLTLVTITAGSLGANLPAIVVVQIFVAVLMEWWSEEEKS